MSPKRIVRVVIEHFQSHAHTVIEPAPGLTVITGPSDAGKSAILRALRWVYRNEPQGTGHIRAGQPRARVTVELCDGTRVTRERSASGAVNRYVVERPGEPPVVLEGFGHGVPEPVREALGTRTVRLGGEELDLAYAEQLGAPFLLGMPGPARAEAIERLTGVHLLAQAAVEAARREQAAQRRAREARERAEELERALSAYADLPERERGLEAFERALEQAEGLGRRLQRLAELRGRLRRTEEALEQAQRELCALRGLDGLARAVEAAGRGVDRLVRLRRLREALLANAQARAAAEAVLQATRGLEEAAAAAEQAERARARLERLCRLRQRLGRHAAARQALEATLRGLADVERGQRLLQEAVEVAQRLERLRRLQLRIGQWKQAMRQVRQALADADRKAREASEVYRRALVEAGRCPTCGQAVDPQALAEHLKEVV